MVIKVNNRRKFKKTDEEQIRRKEKKYEAERSKSKEEEINEADRKQNTRNKKKKSWKGKKSFGREEIEIHIKKIKTKDDKSTKQGPHSTLQKEKMIQQI